MHKHYTLTLWITDDCDINVVVFTMSVLLLDLLTYVIRGRF